MSARLYGWAEKGGVQLTVAGIGQITQPIQASYPNATVTVYDHGTTNLATIFSDSAGTPKSNPFTLDGTIGYWFFYAAAGRYDAGFSGTGIDTPFTLEDVFQCCQVGPTCESPPTASAISFDWFEPLSEPVRRKVPAAPSQFAYAPEFTWGIDLPAADDLRAFLYPTVVATDNGSAGRQAAAAAAVSSTAPGVGSMTTMRTSALSDPCTIDFSNFPLPAYIDPAKVDKIYLVIKGCYDDGDPGLGVWDSKWYVPGLYDNQFSSGAAYCTTRVSLPITGGNATSFDFEGAHCLTGIAGALLVQNTVAAQTDIFACLVVVDYHL